MKRRQAFRVALFPLIARRRSVCTFPARIRRIITVHARVRMTVVGQQPSAAAHVVADQSARVRFSWSIAVIRSWTVGMAGVYASGEDEGRGKSGK